MADSKLNFNWEAAKLRREIGATTAVRGKTKTCQPEKVLRERGGWRRGSHGRSTQRYVKSEEFPLDQPVGTLVASIAVDTSTDVKTTSPKITGSELVGSYNWLDRDASTILVPGGCNPQCSVGISLTPVR